jgi:serine/threonine-protein kinase
MPQVIVASPSESRLVRAGQSGGRIARVGPWELLRLVGGGSLSQVYQASPAGTPPERPAAYALKMPGPARQDDAAAVALLRQEAAAGRAVNHPHVVAILSASLGQPPYYLVMPWLEGATLQQRLDQDRPLDVRTALWIARQVASALDALARALWIHGDVKPSNVFLSPDGHATLLDLGFARPIGAAHCLADRCVLGTPSYMAPELLTSASTADIRSDVYSLGVVLYEMLAGRLPFDAADLGALVSQHRQGSLPRLEKLAPWLPADVVRLVSRMLAKDLLRRPSPAELLRQLTAMEIAALAEAVDGGK